MKLDIKGIIDKIDGYSSSFIGKPHGGEIYRIWFANDPTGKCYIGQTVQGSLARIKQHIADAQNPGSGGCPLLDEATRTFGLNAMRYEVLEDGIETHEELDEAEKYWIRKFDCCYPNGYNVKRGGQGKGDGTIPVEPSMPGIADAVMSGMGMRRGNPGSACAGFGLLGGNPVVLSIAEALIARSDASESTKRVLNKIIR